MRMFGNLELRRIVALNENVRELSLRRIFALNENVWELGR
jgi:hypothetical protein